MHPTYLREVQSWLENLNQFEENGSCSSPAFLKPYHLATIALAVKRCGMKGLKLPENLNSYAARMGLWEAAGLEPPINVPKRDESGRFLPAQPLVDSSKVLQTAESLAEITKENSATSERTVNSLETSLHELIENCFAHAATTGLHGLVVAQPWPRGYLAQIAIADSGIGVRNTLSDGEEYTDILTSRNACELAAEYGVTGKRGRGHSGYGLTLARDLLCGNKGKLSIVSGNEAATWTEAGPYSIEMPVSWNGTLIIFEWRIDNPLDVGAVYSDWPNVEGMDDDDFDF